MVTQIMIDPLQVLGNGTTSESIVITEIMNENNLKKPKIVISANNLDLKDTNDIPTVTPDEISTRTSNLIMGGPPNPEPEIVVPAKSTDSLCGDSKADRTDTNGTTSSSVIYELSTDPNASNYNKHISNVVQSKDTAISGNILSSKVISNKIVSSVTSSPPKSSISEQPSTSNYLQIKQVESLLSSTSSSSSSGMEDNQQRKIHHISNNSPTSTTTDNILPELDNRKVEPLKINLNREPIKTIIKIPKPTQTHENSKSDFFEPTVGNLMGTIPKITIKPIIKRPNEESNTAGNGQQQTQNIPIPKLTLKTSNTPNTPEILSASVVVTEPLIVPKLTIRNSTNASATVGMQSEIVPKLTIAYSHVPSSGGGSTHYHHQAAKPADYMYNKDKCLILDDGLKLTIKSIQEPPIPKLTIKASSNECVDVKPQTTNNATKYTINTPTPPTLPITNPVVTRSSAKSSASLVKNNEISNTIPKIKIKQISKSEEITDKQIPIFEISRLKNLETPESHDIKTVPRLLVRVPKDTKEPEIIKNSDEVSGQTETETSVENTIHTVPKLTIRQVKSQEQSTENIVIPKVTIKPIVDPNNLEADLEVLVTPKITIKPIPKPIDITQPLEVVINNEKISDFVSLKSDTSAGVDAQQSPRIILKINKSVIPNAQQSPSSTITDLESPIVPLSKNSNISSEAIYSQENDLKRPITNTCDIEPKKARFEEAITILDSDDEALPPLPKIESSPVASQSSPSMSFPQEDTELKDILSRIQRNIIKSPVRPTETSEITPIVTPMPLAQKRRSILLNLAAASQSEGNITLPVEMELAAAVFRNEPITKPTQQHPLLLQDIERAKLLESMMNPKKPNTIDCNDKKVSTSNSDCVVVDDNGSLSSFHFNSNQNQFQKSMVTDFRETVTNSNKAIVENQVSGTAALVATPKRGRGRPRKITSAVNHKRKCNEAQVANNNSKASESNAHALEINGTENLTSVQSDVTITKSVLQSFETETISSFNTDSNMTPTLSPVPTFEAVDCGVTLSYSESNDISIIDPSDVQKTSSFETVEKSNVVDTQKERKRRIRIDDDDESPTFNPMSRGTRGRGRGRGRGSRGGRSIMKNIKPPAKLSSTSDGIDRVFMMSMPNKLHDEGGVHSSNFSNFTTPDGKNKVKPNLQDISTTALPLQLFEEDTRMSTDFFSTPASFRNAEFLHNDESQSSLLSTASTSVAATDSGSGIIRKRGKIEVSDPEGKTEFTVDMIAEYDWPPPKGCCPSRNRDTYMLQEQVAEYLGVKSFKRKYPDLPRRMVEMEERNYLMEKGMVSEKMCDLGLTAVLASDLLDIMHNDFYEKYEEYKKFLRVRHIRELSERQRTHQMDTAEKNFTEREHAIRAASSWNMNFNKSRTQDRQQCLDLQTFVVHLPELNRKKMNRPRPAPSSYPVALVPGQFQEYYRNYSAAELLCYPINTALADPIELDTKLREYSRAIADTESESDTDTDSNDSKNFYHNDTSSDDSDSDCSSESSSNEEVRFIDKCRVCDKPQNINKDNKPEVFVMCSACRRRAHPSCIEMPPRMAIRVQDYSWQCTECKHCSKCRQIQHEDKMLFCDQCDRGYHIYCIGLKGVPEGRWHCSKCSICTLCGSRNPEGHKNPNLTTKQRQKLIASSKWTHEYRISHISHLREHSAMLCVPCAFIKSEPLNSVVTTTEQLAESLTNPTGLT